MISPHAEPQRRREVWDLNSLSGVIVDAAYHIHVDLGPGLLESVYQTILSRELSGRGLHVERQKPISFDYKGVWFDNSFVADIIVEHCIIIEIKAARTIHPVHERQLQTYLKLLDYRLGLLLNFGAPYMKDGIRRIVNKI